LIRNFRQRGTSRYTVKKKKKKKKKNLFITNTHIHQTSDIGLPEKQ